MRGERFSLIIFFLLVSVLTALAQPSRQQWDSISKVTAADHQLMMSVLGITSLRPGVDGMNPNAPNAANYDEAKANPYPLLPDPLKLKSGRQVTNAKAWWKKRRPEIVEDFDREVYGRVPEGIPPVEWEVLSETSDTVGLYHVKIRTLEGHVRNPSFPGLTVDIQLTLTVPADAEKSVPVIMELGFIWPAGMQPPPSTGDQSSWQEQVLDRGWGYAILLPYSVQADYGAGLTQGIIGLMNRGEPRKPDDWGALRAWAWGASCALDYFETDPWVDASHVGIEGHSRFGKAALIAMAYDQRFAIGFISSSGAGGAKLYRRNAGEIVENLAASGEYHWMAGNFLKYAGPLTWDDLPVDSHELIALCAPRPVFISSGDKGDGWVDARGMFMSASAAGPVYRLLGKKDMGTDEFPSVGQALTEGEIAFRQHSGGHTPGPNWPVFLEYVSRYFAKEKNSE
jgi:hypothetical protein